MLKSAGKLVWDRSPMKLIAAWGMIIDNPLLMSFPTRTALPTAESIPRKSVRKIGSVRK